MNPLRCVCSLLIALLAFIFFSCLNEEVTGTSSEEGNAIIAGRLVDESGTPVKGAKVLILSSDYNPLPDLAKKTDLFDILYTDENGEFKSDSLPVISSNRADENLALICKSRSHLHLSRLTRFYLQLNRPEVALFSLWALRELIALAEKQKEAQHFTRNGLQLMGLVDEKQHGQIRQVLVVPSGIEAKVSGRISGIDEEGNPGKGGETCPKR